mgnify:CR=1 FL=1
MAKVAAKSILGEPAKYQGFYNGAATKVYNYKVGGTGFTEKAAKENGLIPVVGYAEVTTRFPILPGAEKIKVKLIADLNTRKIIGGQVVGSEGVTERIDLITYAIQQKSTVDDIAMLSYASQPYQTAFPANNAMVMAAEEILEKLKEQDKVYFDSSEKVV